MGTAIVRKAVDVKVLSEVYVEVVCSECDERLEIESAENGGRYKEDDVIVTIKPHTCKALSLIEGTTTENVEAVQSA